MGNTRHWSCPRSFICRRSRPTRPASSRNMRRGCSKKWRRNRARLPAFNPVRKLVPVFRPAGEVSGQFIPSALDAGEDGFGETPGLEEILHLAADGLPEFLPAARVNGLVANNREPAGPRNEVKQYAISRRGLAHLEAVELVH